MASIHWHKMTKQMITSTGYNIHFDLNARDSHDHSNKDINHSFGLLNYNIGPDWSESKNILFKRFKESERRIPHKNSKNRIIGVMLNLVCPNEIALNSDRFFYCADQWLKEYFGTYSVITTMVHEDEVHEYKDYMNGKNRMSLLHAHVLILPYTEEDGVLSRKFVSKENMKGLNDFFDDKVFNEFGIHYNNGKECVRASVDELKSISSEMSVNERSRYL